jgi:Glutathione S-transferase, C-terminal domain
MRINREGMKANLMNESNPLRQLNELGQSVWLDYMRRSLISSGELQRFYSIADIAVYPWIVPWEMQSQDLGHFPALKRWFDAIAARPATARAYERGAALKAPSVVTDDSRKILSGQPAAKHQR